MHNEEKTLILKNNARLFENATAWRKVCHIWVSVRRNFMNKYYLSLIPALALSLMLSGGTVGIMALSNALVIALVWVLESGKMLNTHRPNWFSMTASNSLCRKDGKSS